MVDGGVGMPKVSTATVVVAITVSVVVSILYYSLRGRKTEWRHDDLGESPVVVDEQEEAEEDDVEEEVAAAASVVPSCCSTEFAKKPQYKFKRALADNSYAPFAHFKKTLKEHPFEDEITFLLEHPTVIADLVASHDCPADMGASCVWVHTQEQLESLADLLSKERIFAVDTEQHNVRSFLGFTALMQISTRNDDFLLDTIALHDVMSILQPVFANSSICKVFHGCDNDLLWLQRDFHIYVVHMFDTAKACMVLSKPKKSLAYLLETYCGVVTNKRLQREDWRKRPLSAEMTHYARTDVHYLLYIVQCLASELEIKGLACKGDKQFYVTEAYRRSNMGCMQLYTKEVQPSWDSAAASIIFRYSSSEVGPLRDDRSKETIRKLCIWRDLMARIHDENLQYVLSDKAIISLGTKVPRDPKSIYGVIECSDCTNDYLDQQQFSFPSPVVKGHVRDICCILCETTENLIRKIFQRYSMQAKICPLSIYNYALLSDLNGKLDDSFFSKQNGRQSEGHVGRKASRELFVQKFSCKSPVYHNCRIYASDGRLLCYCDQRKIDWYLKRKLAKIVEHDPPGIELLFEPKGRPEDEDNEFYIQSKKNICVGCGEKNHYLRYRIIPSCYRIHFPEQLKSHRSHDIVLLCVDCHEIAHSAAEKYKKQVAAEFKIPLFVRKVLNSEKNKVITIASSTMEGNEEVGVSPLHLRTAAMALVRHGSKMPFERREELLKTIKLYFGKNEISAKDIETALLVGMSPHEKRKLERKRGLNFKVSEINTVCSINTYTVEETIECVYGGSNHEDIFPSSRRKNSEVSYARDNFNDERKSMSSYSSSDFNFSLNKPANYVSNVDGKALSKKLVEQQNAFIVQSSNDYFDGIENEDRAEDTDHIEAVSARHAKKLSLLGHGPHGKEVVDYILKEQGEGGILQFCQRWRQVFVDAIQPRYLPAGWDIMHSGRREFGEHSVYNFSKKPVAAD